MSQTSSKAFEQQSLFNPNGVCVFVLFATFVVVCGGEPFLTADAPPKLVAMMKLTAALKSGPDNYAGNSEREEWDRKIRTLQQDFESIPFDARKDPETAKTIIEIFKNQLEGRYSGGNFVNLDDHISQMHVDLLDR